MKDDRVRLPSLWSRLLRGDDDEEVRAELMKESRMSNSGSGRDGKLLDFPEDPDSVEIGTSWDRPKAKCRHKRVKLSHRLEQRWVWCADCGDPLDPFEVLYRYAKTDDRLRGDAEAWRELEESWAWIREHRASVNLSHRGVKGHLKVNGKRRQTSAGMGNITGGLAVQIVAVVEALRQAMRWGQQ